MFLSSIKNIHSDFAEKSSFSCKAGCRLTKEGKSEKLKPCGEFHVLPSSAAIQLNSQLSCLKLRFSFYFSWQKENRNIYSDGK